MRHHHFFLIKWFICCLDILFPMFVLDSWLCWLSLRFDIHLSIAASISVDMIVLPLWWWYFPLFSSVLIAISPAMIVSLLWCFDHLCHTCVLALMLLFLMLCISLSIDAFISKVLLPCCSDDSSPIAILMVFPPVILVLITGYLFTCQHGDVAAIFDASALPMILPMILPFEYTLDNNDVGPTLTPWYMNYWLDLIMLELWWDGDVASIFWCLCSTSDSSVDSTLESTCDSTLESSHDCSDDSTNNLPTSYQQSRLETTNDSTAKSTSNPKQDWQWLTMIDNDWQWLTII